MMVCQLLVVWLNFCFNHCQLFVNQGATSSFFQKYSNTHKKRDAKKVRPNELIYFFLSFWIFIYFGCAGSFFIIVLLEANYFTILYWFCHTSTWICHRCTCSPSWTPPPTSLPIPSLWVIPVHQPGASCIMHRTWTGNSFHIWYYTCFNAILPIISPSPSPRESKRLFYTSVSLVVLHTGLSLPSF